MSMIECSCGGKYNADNKSAIEHFNSKLHSLWAEWQKLIPELVECPCGIPYMKLSNADVIEHYKAPLHRKWEEWNVLKNGLLKAEADVFEFEDDRNYEEPVVRKKTIIPRHEKVKPPTDIDYSNYEGY